MPTPARSLASTELSALTTMGTSSLVSARYRSFLGMTAQKAYVPGARGASPVHVLDPVSRLHSNDP